MNVKLIITLSIFYCISIGTKVNADQSPGDGDDYASRITSMTKLSTGHDEHDEVDNAPVNENPHDIEPLFKNQPNGIDPSRIPSPREISPGKAQGRSFFKPIQEAAKTFTAILATIDLSGLFPGALTTIVDVIEKGKDVLQLFGFGPKDVVILWDKGCSGCDIWIRCWKDKGLFGREYLHWIEVEDDEGGILKFTSWLPNYIPTMGKWACTIEDRSKGKSKTIDVWGGSVPKKYERLLVVENGRLTERDMKSPRKVIGTMNY